MTDDWANLPEKVDASYIVTDHSPNFYHQKRSPIALDTENAPDGSLGQWSVAYRDDFRNLCVAPYYGHQRANLTSRVIMHNAKWDLRVLKNNKMQEPEDVVDTMIAAYCLGLGKQDVRTDETYSDAGMIGGLGLKYLARRHLGMEMETWQDVKDNPEKIPEYNAKDSVSTYLLWEKWLPKIPQFFWDIDMPLLRVLMAMEDRGICIDPRQLDTFANSLDESLAQIELPLNPFSPKQIAEYVYNGLNIEPWKFTATGQPSTEEDVLETIDDPVVKKILAYKRLYKERGTYIQNYLERLSPEGRIHPEFKQCSTATARLSCARPNLQNVPKDDSEMRKLFVAPNGRLLVRVDWSQLELRFFAAYVGEEAMIEAFKRGDDIHAWTGERMAKLGKILNRTDMKKINFRIQYGGGAWGLSQEFHIPIDDAKEIQRVYFEAFPGIKKYMADIREQCEDKKEVVNWVGRKRRMDAMYASDWRIREQGIREGINTPIQGGAHEIVKLAMIRLHYDHNAPLLLQVHDELLFEVEKDQAIEYAKWLEGYIPTLNDLNGMRFPVDLGVGRNWQEAMGGKCPQCSEDTKWDTAKGLWVCPKCDYIFDVMKEAMGE